MAHANAQPDGSDLLAIVLQPSLASPDLPPPETLSFVLFSSDPMQSLFLRALSSETSKDSLHHTV
jgi:hypothetical protein